jgi:hypothetical protein
MSCPICDVGDSRLGYAEEVVTGALILEDFTCSVKRIHDIRTYHRDVGLTSRSVPGWPVEAAVRIQRQLGKVVWGLNVPAAKRTWNTSAVPVFNTVVETGRTALHEWY